jgi:hypothetical protein
LVDMYVFFLEAALRGALIASYPFLQGIGCTKITKARNEGSMNGNSESRSYLEKKLVFCFGSYIAARMLLPFGEENFLSSSELKQAQEVVSCDTLCFWNIFLIFQR